MKHKRLEGEEYVHLIDEFMAAVRDKWPDVLVQFEDFTNDHAFSLLARYRKKYFCFNDDIQGTGAVITAGFLNAAKLSGIPLDKHRLVFLGAGSAGVGVADAIVNAMVHDESCKGLTEHAARKFFWFLDSRGLITKNRSGTLEEHKVSYAREDNGDKQYASLLEVVKNVKPTALIGLAGLDGGVFTKEIIEAMAEYNQRPIIFALSNPTKKNQNVQRKMRINLQMENVFLLRAPLLMMLSLKVKLMCLVKEIICISSLDWVLVRWLLVRRKSPKICLWSRHASFHRVLQNKNLRKEDCIPNLIGCVIFLRVLLLVFLTKLLKME